MRPRPPGSARTAVAPAAASARVLLGRGRSGSVYLEHSRRGVRVAAKAFHGEPAADAVHLLLSGAPNPYRWCEEAVRCAFLRRRILTQLVRLWFGERLVVADALGMRWDGRSRCWVLTTRYLPGHPVALHHPFSGARDHEQRELRDEVMRPLQEHLRAAGFDGLLWQAGLGNPVAANNFLVLERRRSRAGRGTRWAWIDLESGVPALFPADPRALLQVYLPLSRRHGRPLFDDVDTCRLARYLNAAAAELRARLGAETLARLREWTRQLGETQRRWRDLSRLERSLRAALAAGRIDRATAERFRGHPTRWAARETARRAWRARGQLTAREAAVLGRLTLDGITAAYLNDLAVHLVLKPLYKPVALAGLPALAQAGLISWPAALIGIAFAGSICRTVYTGWRCLRALARRQPPPLTALAVGVLPVVGTAAFPLQIVRQGAGAEGQLAAFLLYDSIGGIGRRLPVWGGEDTATEHLCNRLVDRLVPRRPPLLAPLPVRRAAADQPPRTTTA